MSTYRVAVIGSGPSGFYAAGALLDADELDVRVDLYDRLATPWGLVRAGVAPDHPKIKSVSAQYEKIAAHDDCRFFGNIELGRHVTRDELLERYHAIIYAVGSQTDRSLGIPGEHLPGSWSATDFVGWYNGHPDYAELEFDLSGKRAVVVGNGNVALDVARMLVLSPSELARTDIADHALDALAGSDISDVVVLGRRGAAQAAFTTTELRELDDIAGLVVAVDPQEVPSEGDVDAGSMTKAVRRNLDLMREWATSGPTRAAARQIAFRFHRSPVELRGDGRVEEVVLAVTELQTDAGGLVRAVDTGKREVVPADLVFRAVGYRGVALPGIPFDDRRGVIPNQAGKIEGREREYVVGWIRRGPTGIIGTNRKDANETVRHLFADLPTLARKPVQEAAKIQEWLTERQPDLVTDEGWQAIDVHERGRGKPHGRPRVKLTSTEDLVGVSRSRGQPSN
ncbi:FAD-dependent oxidoreductase [Pseudonocardia nigra]|uniref:FAD-dependent oxidoreductase n=1 Tax=Pseudonocardia nigra TaxID=1921578 RepID=UPI001C5DDEBD|nr:FAD-dependent oxidoreductase [Pseudonocardia nigra]